MKKSDLKTGMTVELRNGDLFKVLRDTETNLHGHEDIMFAGIGNYFVGDNYKNDLTSFNREKLDIVKIYAKKSDHYILTFDTSILIWERKKESDVWEGSKIGDVCVWNGNTSAIFKIKKFKGNCCSALNNDYYDSMHYKYVRKATDFEKILLGNNDIYIK